MLPQEQLSDNENSYNVNPYESFMKRHLQHYGYYTGKNQNYKNQFYQFSEWEKNIGFELSSSSSGSESDSEDQDKTDTKLQEDLLKTTQLTFRHGEHGRMVPSLKEPRNLYALSRELGPQQAARWPSDLQVIGERIVHSQAVPVEQEPFYKTNGTEKCPMVKGESGNARVVFNYSIDSTYFMKSRVGGSKNGCEECAVALESDEDKTLIFESRFESGNLGKVVQVGEFDYELWLRYDLYTSKHTQWFYFRVSNTRKNQEYRFTIVNFMKPDSLYNNGMRPVVYSERESVTSKTGWTRGCRNIKYYRNNLRYEQSRSDKSYYSLTFTTDFKYDNDTVYFSHCYPYTYTDLQDYLLELSNDPIKSRICKQRVLCRTLAGNLVYILTITSSSQNPEDMKHKKAVVVTARVHPGESNSSWMMKGFLDFVTSNSPDAKLLRDSFIFKVVPMLNPDGVIVGNYRCSLSGRDLNRNYKTSLKDAYPSVWHTKTMVRKLLQERDVIVYCDLHGHSRKQNVFIYGCEQMHNSNKRFHEKVFPNMLNKNTPDKFCFNSCRFKVQKSKEGTGRVVMWNMGIMNSYTLEATFCGSCLGGKKGFHFNQKDFEMMGYHFCDTLLDYCDPDNTKYSKILIDLEDKHKLNVINKLNFKGLHAENVDLSDVSTDMESSDGGSDSSVSDGPPVHLQFAVARPKKKKLKTKKDRDKSRTIKEKLLPSPTQDIRRARNNQVKPLKLEHNKLPSQPMRYTSNSPKRAHSLDDRTSCAGVPVFVQERFEEKQQKKNDYLEALTAAYMNNNIPIVSDPAEPESGKPLQREHQSEKFSSQKKNHREISVTGNDIASFADNAPVASVWSLKGKNKDQHASVVHFRYSGSGFEIPLQMTRMDGLCAHHEQALASHLVAKHPNRIAEDPGMEALLQTHLQHSASIHPLDRKHKPHLVEVSAAQQRQTDALKDINSPIKTHPNPFDEKEKNESRKGARTQVPPATYVDYDTFSVNQVPQQDRPPSLSKIEENDQNRRTSLPGNDSFATESAHTNQSDHHRDREKSGRKSRKGMYDPKDDPEFSDGQVQNIKMSHNDRNKREEDLDNKSFDRKAILSSKDVSHKTIKNQEQLKQDETFPTENSIHKLIEEKTEEIKELSDEIKSIKKKQKSVKSKSRIASKELDTINSQSRLLKKLDEENMISTENENRSIKTDSIDFPTNLSSSVGLQYKDRNPEEKAYPTSMSPQIINKAALASHKQTESLSYSVNSQSITESPEGVDFIIANKRKNQSTNPILSKNASVDETTYIEEEARHRSLQRQASFRESTKKVNKNIGNQINTDSRTDKDTSKNSAVGLGEIDSSVSHYRQLSSSNYSRGIIQSAGATRLKTTNLVFTPSGEVLSEAESEQPEYCDRLSKNFVTEEASDRSELRGMKSARSNSRQIIETVPTKISITINDDHGEKQNLNSSRSSKHAFHWHTRRK